MINQTYNDQPVLTINQVASLFEQAPETIKQNIRDNKERFNNDERTPFPLEKLTFQKR